MARLQPQLRFCERAQLRNFLKTRKDRARNEKRPLTPPLPAPLMQTCLAALRACHTPRIALLSVASSANTTSAHNMPDEEATGATSTGPAC